MACSIADRFPPRSGCARYRSPVSISTTFASHSHSAEKRRTTMQPATRRSGFTLIELMVAIGIGSMIIYAAFVGLRASMQAVSACSRLGTENSLIRAGMMAAFDELDFWRSYDDPVDSTRQRLRD